MHFLVFCAPKKNSIWSAQFCSVSFVADATGIFTPLPSVFLQPFLWILSDEVSERRNITQRRNV